MNHVYPMKSARALALLGFVAVTVLGCQTSRSAAALKGKSGETTVLVGHDARSATPRPFSKAWIKEASGRLKAKSKKPQDDADTQVALAQLALTDGNLVKAREQARRALAIDFRDRDAKLVVAHVAYLEHRYEEAQALLAQLGGEGAKESEALTLMASLAWVDGDSRRAESLLEKAVGKNGDDLAARMNLGILYLLRENDAGAERQFLDVLGRVPDNADARIHLGISYARRGRFADAEAAYKLAAKTAGKNSLLLYNLAVVQRRAGKFDEALATTRRLLEDRKLSIGEQEHVLALLSDIRVDKAVNGKGDGAEVDELIAATREKIRTGSPESEDAVIDPNLGVVGH